MPLLVRSNTVMPISRSKSRTAAVTLGCDTKSRRAASVTLPHEATSTMYLSCWSFMGCLLSMVGCTGLESTLQLFNQISHRRGLTWLNKQLVGTLWFYGRMDVTLMGHRTFAEVVCAR
ncbi:Uncharacterised protein [Collinsella intestinalis]|nr:Uncharacterised protein [Collinsella intestinalis]